MKWIFMTEPKGGTCVHEGTCRASGHQAALVAAVRYQHAENLKTLMLDLKAIESIAFGRKYVHIRYWWGNSNLAMAEFRSEFEKSMYENAHS